MFNASGLHAEGHGEVSQHQQREQRKSSMSMRGVEAYVEGHDFNDMILQGEDSWLILFLPHQPESRLRSAELSLAPFRIRWRACYCTAGVGFHGATGGVEPPRLVQGDAPNPEEYWDSAMEDGSLPRGCASSS